ncbi:MerR family transcriptional regulator [Undibacterium sp. TS12]|uniref:MerR family transcriptional regulator n=1 Tax=Undibacterium sp. TS12 TaxID=2908202 RepID=UPI001F4C78E8|nr:MerR family transcriptional regulator [Undibacterium sp. TS12]MCH8621634.1 MerR family transcriptional regulator [Undibacterium sp. TS12]
MLLKIGELASRTGLTIRTLHHYDKIGLLKPSIRSDAGYRLYDSADVKRLHRIQALRRLDLSLAEVASIIDGEGADLQDVIADQISSLDQQIAQSVELRDRLHELSSLLQAKHEPNLEYWLSTLEMMSLLGKYFSRDEILHMRELESGDKGKIDLRMQPMVIAARALLDQKIPANDPRAKQLAQKWVLTMNDLIPDPRLLKKFSTMHRKEPSLQALSGVDDEMMDYITIASIEVRYDIYRKYLSEEELKYFRPSFVKNAENWTAIFSEVRQRMVAGLPPEHPEVQAQLLKWRALFMDAWGHHLPTMQKVRAIHEKEPDLAIGGGMTPSLMVYARQGLALLEQNASLAGKTQ